MKGKKIYYIPTHPLLHSCQDRSENKLKDISKHRNHFPTLHFSVHLLTATLNGRYFLKKVRVEGQMLKLSPVFCSPDRVPFDGSISIHKVLRGDRQKPASGLSGAGVCSSFNDDGGKEKFSACKPSNTLQPRSFTPAVLNPCRLSSILYVALLSMLLEPLYRAVIHRQLSNSHNNP